MKDILRYRLDRREFFETAAIAGLVRLQPVQSVSTEDRHAATSITSSVAERNERLSAPDNGRTSDVILSNDHIRLRFHQGQPYFAVFPKGYVSYTLDIKEGSKWIPMATAPYFCGYCYRAVHWGRDWLAYVAPEKVNLHREQHSTTAEFSAHHVDVERVGWHFTFTFTVRKEEPVVEVGYRVSVDQQREILLFWGPRLYAGEGTFGAAKDEALFPGLEYLNSKERSSSIWALAPDAKLNFVPHPAKVSIPLMAVMHHRRMVGLMWDPMQKWNGKESCPSALFASPNWIESKPNHLLGLFLPSIPRYVSENNIRAHTPVVIEGGSEISLKCRLFASHAEHVVDAVDIYLDSCGGLPRPSPPMEYETTLETLVQDLTTNAWIAEAKGWREFISDLRPGSEFTSADPKCITTLAAAIPLLKNRDLARQTRMVLQEALETNASRPRPLAFALRTGGVEQALLAEHRKAIERIRTQQPDGSWAYINSVEGGKGLVALHGPPEPGVIGFTGSRDEGLTAGNVAPLLEYVLISADRNTLRAALCGISDLDRYSIPFGFGTDGGYECPHCPSLHGAYLGLRSYLLAYRITGEKRYLKRAAYWAKAGLPFIYLWSLPARDVDRGEIETHTYVLGDQLYRDTQRAPMLYGSLYGYGSSQFVASWCGVLVDWIALVYGQDLIALAECDQSLPWKRIAEGMLVLRYRITLT